MIQKEHTSKGVKSFARFSDCEKYRYTLTRIFGHNSKKIVFIGLNPSTADEIKNDPTVARMINFAKALGYGTITVCNLFSYRATFPKDLKNAADPIGKETDFWLKYETESADKVIAAWGNHGAFNQRSKEVLAFLPKDKAYSFGATKLGEPKHVLYLPYNATVLPFKE